MKAIDHFDPTIGVKLSSYAIFWLRASCSDLAAAERDVIYVPYEAAKRYNEICRARDKLQEALKR